MFDRMPPPHWTDPSEGQQPTAPDSQSNLVLPEVQVEVQAQDQVHDEVKNPLEKKWERKDLLEAADPKAVMEAYHNLIKARYTDRADLQSAVGERLNQLGDIEHGMQFTLMSEQTRNAERFGLMIGAYQDVTNHFSNKVGEFEEHIGKLGQSMNLMEESARTMERAALRLSDFPAQMNGVVSNMGESIEQFRQASSRLSSVAEEITQSSYRMSR